MKTAKEKLAELDTWVATEGKPKRKPRKKKAEKSPPKESPEPVSEEVTEVRLRAVPPAPDVGVTNGHMARITADAEYIAGRDSEMDRAIEELRENVGRATQAELGISDLLEKQRQDHLIPTGCFGSRPIFDWVHLYQLGDKDKVELYETYGASKIVMPETVREAKRDQACRAVLLAAGPGALDLLRTNGIEIGHTVRFVKFTPFRLLADYVRSKEFWILAMRAESIESSETLEQEIRAKKAEVIWDNTYQMHVVSREGDILGAPKSAWSPQDETAK